MKRLGDLRRMSGRGFNQSLAVIPLWLRKSTAKSSAGLALDPIATGIVIGASANFLCTSTANGDGEARVIYCSLV